MCQLSVDLGGLTEQGCAEPLASQPLPQPSLRVSVLMTMKTAPWGVLPSGPWTGQRLVLKLARSLWAAQPGCSAGPHFDPPHSSECCPYVVEEAEAETR